MGCTVHFLCLRREVWQHVTRPIKICMPTFVTSVGIHVMQRVSLPDVFVPENAKVEITAKISAGYVCGPVFQMQFQSGALVFKRGFHFEYYILRSSLSFFDTDTKNSSNRRTAGYIRRLSWVENPGWHGLETDLPLVIHCVHVLWSSLWFATFW